MIDKSTAPAGTTHAWVDFDGSLRKWLTQRLDGVYTFWNGDTLAAIPTEPMLGHGKILTIDELPQ